MDLMLVAAVLAMARVDDPRRYEGCLMFSALPKAPTVVPTRLRERTYA